MVEGAEEYIGKMMLWSEIAKRFPHCYVALDEYSVENGESKGILRCVYKKEKDMLPILREYAEKGSKLHTRYTTETRGWNGLWQI